jgi:hypothetical protein
MTLPAPLHVRHSALARLFPFFPSQTTPQSPRQLQRLLSSNHGEGGDGDDGRDLDITTDYPYRQVPRNLEDVVGAVGRWYEGGSSGNRRDEGSRHSDRWRKWTSRAPLIGTSVPGHATEVDPNLSFPCSGLLVVCSHICAVCRMGSARPAIRHPPSTPAFPIRVSAFYLLPTPDISSTHSLFLVLFQAGGLPLPPRNGRVIAVPRILDTPWNTGPSLRTTTTTASTSSSRINNPIPPPRLVHSNRFRTRIRPAGESHWR